MTIYSNGSLTSIVQDIQEENVHVEEWVDRDQERRLQEIEEKIERALRPVLENMQQNHPEEWTRLMEMFH